MRRKDREVTDLKDIVSILDSCKTCHVAMQDDGEIYMLPLSYGYEMRDQTLILYFHSATKGRKIDIWQKNPKVCFNICREGEVVHADTPCDSGYYYASITGWREVKFREEQASSVCVYKIVSDRYTAKRKQKPAEA